MEFSMDSFRHRARDLATRNLEKNWARRKRRFLCQKGYAAIHMPTRKPRFDPVARDLATAISGKMGREGNNGLLR